MMKVDKFPKLSASTVLKAPEIYLLSFDLSALAMSTDSSQVGVALFPSF
jgi:hypothetical protein